MNTFRVFHHNVEQSPRSFREEAYRTEWPDGYREVAQVEATCLGEVFQLTNHIDDAWTDGDRVTLLPHDAERLARARAVNPACNSSILLGIRSTSVGDVITRVDALGYERIYGVAGMGFEEITNIALTPEDWGLKAVSK